MTDSRAAALAALRADLQGYTVDAVEALLGPVAAAALHREQSLPARRALAGSDDPLATLVRVFTLGQPVTGAELARALPRTGVEPLVGLGIIVRDGDQVRARLELRPMTGDTRTWLVASDFGELATGRPLAPDHVLGVGGASATLLSWTPRPRAVRALDVGTGCGVQALLLTGHCDRVTATDISARALEIARLNAELNGCAVDLRRGSFLEPVAGERFDLVVANPPFVITPRRADVPRYEYRDGGAEGDAVVANLVRELPAHLAPGGIAQLLGNWELRDGEEWTERVGGWLAGMGLDAYVVQRETQDVAEYAETWIRDGGTRPGTPQFEAMYGAWLDDFAARGVTHVGFGVLSLRAPSARRSPAVRLEDAPGAVRTPMGPAVLETLTAMELLAQMADEEVLATTWTVPDDVMEERFTLPGADDPTLIRLHRGGGTAGTFDLGTAEAALVSVCRGEITAGQAATAIGALLDEEGLPARLVPAIRELATGGFLRRA